MNLRTAQEQHTKALRAWIATTGPGEPGALAALDQARAALRDAFNDRCRALPAPWQQRPSGR